ncbi:TPA: hypothetical protein RHK77_002719 [Enterococcus faecalis]|nr:hypothetical protein [Enterococcus faecalis]
MKNRNFPPMKYTKGQKVQFKCDGKTLHGIIKILDFGGSFDNDYHSYDILVREENMLY